METFDIILDADGELQVTSDGDFVTGDNANNLIYYLLVSYPGHYRTAQNSNVGIGIQSYLNSAKTRSQIETAITRGLKNDVFPRPLVDASGFPEIIVNKVKVRLGN